MKKIFSLIVLFLLICSCSSDDRTDFLFQILPIESVDIPDEFTLGETYQITLHYKRPTTCDYFNKIYYIKELNVRTVVVENIVEQRNNCQTLTDEIEDYTFNFLVTSNGSYIFKFWQGKDSDGNNLYLEYEIPVTN